MYREGNSVECKHILVKAVYGIKKDLVCIICREELSWGEAREKYGVGSEEGVSSEASPEILEQVKEDVMSEIANQIFRQSNTKKEYKESGGR